MGLRGLGQEFLINDYYEHPRSSERGGVLTLNSVSGIDYADYTPDPSGRMVIGIKLNDHWYTEPDRQPDPGLLRRANIVEDIARALYLGEVITDWVHPDYVDSIKPGDTAYAGPSGMLVNDQAYGGGKIGTFRSTVGSAYYGLQNHDSYTVMWYGMGLTYEWTDPDTKEIVQVNPDQIYLSSGGWVKLRVDVEGG